MLFVNSKSAQSERKDNERENYPVDAFEEYKKNGAQEKANDEKNMGFHSVESYDRILGEGQGDVRGIPGSFDPSKNGKTDTSSSTTKPVQEELTRSTIDPNVVSGVYNMNLGEKTDIKTGQTTSSHGTEEPLESYIPGVGRKNRPSNAGMMGEHTHSDDHHQSTESQHYDPLPIHHTQEKEEPLESYIPGVGHRNHPIDPEMAEEGRMGHTTTHQSEAPGENLGQFSTEPHIPGTGRITQPSQHMKESHFNPDEMTARKMDSQHMSSQSTAVPGFESRERTRIPGTQSKNQYYDIQNDTIDRGNVPRPAHLNDSPSSGVNAPARRDSRDVSQFNEPSDFEPKGRQSSSHHSEPAAEIPAHSYGTQRSDLGTSLSESSTGQKMKGADVATAEPAGSHGKDGSTSGHRGSGNDVPSGTSTHGQDVSKSTSHTDSSSHWAPKIFGKEIGFNKSHHEESHKTTHDRDSSHSGPKIFGKELNIGKKHHEREGEAVNNPISPKKSADVSSAGAATGITGERARTGSTTSTGERRGSTGSTGDKSKQYPSKRATVEDQPTLENLMEPGTKKTDRSLSIGSGEAGSYAKKVVNMPSLVDPSVPTYRHKEEMTVTGGEGTYKLHSENLTERKVSVGSQEHDPHSSEFETNKNKSNLPTGMHHAGEGHGDHEPIAEESFERKEVYSYGPQTVPRSHPQGRAPEEHEEKSHEHHTKPGVLDKIRNVITHHNDS